MQTTPLSPEARAIRAEIDAAKSVAMANLERNAPGMTAAIAKKRKGNAKALAEICARVDA